MVKGFRLIASLPLQIFRHFSFSLARAKLRTPFPSYGTLCVLLFPRP